MAEWARQMALDLTMDSDCTTDLSETDDGFDAEARDVAAPKSYSLSAMADRLVEAALRGPLCIDEVDDFIRIATEFTGPAYEEEIWDFVADALDANDCGGTLAWPLTPGLFATPPLTDEDRRALASWAIAARTTSGEEIANIFSSEVNSKTFAPGSDALTCAFQMAADATEFYLPATEALLTTWAQAFLSGQEYVVRSDESKIMRLLRLGFSSQALAHWFVHPLGGAYHYAGEGELSPPMIREQATEALGEDDDGPRAKPRVTASRATVTSPQTRNRPLTRRTPILREVLPAPLMGAGRRNVYLDDTLDELGVDLVRIDLSKPRDAAYWRKRFEWLDRIVLFGGPDIPREWYLKAGAEGLDPNDPDANLISLRDVVERLFTQWALDEGKATRGICRGMQLLNVVAGGTLWTEVASTTDSKWAGVHRSGNHAVYVDPTSAFAARVRPYAKSVRATGNEPFAGTNRRFTELLTFPVVSRHHQCVRDVAPGFRPVAWSADGLIEAIEHIDDPERWWAVQFHPECSLDDLACHAITRAILGMREEGQTPSLPRARR